MKYGRFLFQLKKEESYDKIFKDSFVVGREIKNGTKEYLYLVYCNDTKQPIVWLAKDEGRIILCHMPIVNISDKFYKILVVQSQDGSNDCIVDVSKMVIDFNNSKYLIINILSEEGIKIRNFLFRIIEIDTIGLEIDVSTLGTSYDLNMDKVQIYYPNDLDINRIRVVLDDKSTILTIGNPKSLTKNIFTINRPEISRHHCTIWFQGAYKIQDEKSTNGTFLNETRLSPKTPTLLKNGDVIGLAKSFKMVVFGIR